MSLLKPASNAAASLVLIGLSGFGVAGLSGIGHRWVDILAQFTAPVLLAATVLTLACLVLRLWPAFVVGVLAGLVLLAAVWPQWMTPLGRPQPDQPIIRLYSANLWVDNTDVAAIRRSIVDADADIVVLVEVGDAPADRLDEVLAGYPNRAVMGRIEDPSGRALSIVASRYPIQGKLTRPWPYQYQWGQINQVMALTARREKAAPHPTIVAGDFNSVSSARIGRQIQSDMNLSPAPGFPGTWPSRLPAFAGITIDQVYRSPDLALISRRIGEPTGSDHYPVVTEFTRAKP